jgi:hypothetical protein
MVAKISNKVRRLNSLKVWSVITGMALVAALVLTLLPINVQISTDGFISIDLRYGQAQEIGEIVALRTSNSKTYYLGNGQYALNSSIGAVHYLDGQESWQNIDCDYSELDTGNFTARFTKLPYLVRMGDDCRRRIYPDRNDLSYWVEVAKPFPSMGTPTKVGGYWVWNFPNALIAVQIRPHAVKLGFRLKNNLAPTSITFPFSSQGITRNGNELLHNDEVVAYLQKPTAIDANGVERDCTINFDAGQITISLNTTGLVFPIDVDPTFSVGASSDDCYVAGSPPSTMSLDYAHQKTGKTTVSLGGGMRFTSVTIPQGATIDTAYITLICSVTTSSTTVNTDLTGEDIDDAATFSAIANYNARTRTTALVAWDSIPGWTGGTSYNTPSITSIIQEIVDRGGWASGQDMVVFWEDGGSSADANRYGASWDHTTYNPPALYVEYTSLVPEITNSPSSWAIGVIPINTSSNTTINYFTINNTGNCAVDITIQGTNLTGGDDTWVLSGTATPGENIYGLYAGKDDADDLFDVVVNTTANLFVSSLAEDATQAWGLNLTMPTSLNGYDAQQMSGTVTLVASAS